MADEALQQTETADDLEPETADSPAMPEQVPGPKMDRATLFKFMGLLAFILLTVLVVIVAWPHIAEAFSEGGVEALVQRMQNAGAFGVFILLGMQFLQIVVAFIPGEVVQMAAGVMYGPWIGSLLILIGCVFSSTLIYKMVHALGAPFVQGMVSTEHLEKFRKFEQTGKLDVVVFILFLIPGMPKDVFTYLVPLTDMEYKKFIVLTTIGRTPGVVGSAYAAAGFASGDVVGAGIVIGVLLIIAVVAIVFRDKIIGAFEKEHG